MTSKGKCPTCGSSNWHNAWLCIECGHPNVETWREYIRAGYFYPRSQEGKMKAVYHGVAR